MASWWPAFRLGATLNPYEAASYFSAEGESMRQAFNGFVLSSHVCDDTVDFDLVPLDS